jgi:23S rRNA pseudouridine1911/1915/1917 synthase
MKPEQNASPDLQDFDPNYPPYVERTFIFDVPAKQTPMRLDVFLTEYIANATRSKVQTAIDAGNVSVNGVIAGKASRKVLPLDHIECRVMKPPPLTLVPEAIPLEICYEDDAVLVINKPAGMVTHPGFGNRYGTLVNAVLYHLGVREAIPLEASNDEVFDDERSTDEGEEHTDTDDEELAPPFFAPSGSESSLYSQDSVRPGIVHRLDKDTSGILVVSKEIACHAKLSKQFADRTAKRQYYALVWGKVKEDVGIIEGNIGRSSRDRKIMSVVAQGGKYACTEYEVIERFGACTLLALKLRTGRTHQIRVHCTSIHHPLVGDEAYGGLQPNISGGNSNSAAIRHHVTALLQAIPRQALHARTLGFTHPVNGSWMEFAAELPADFAAALEIARVFTK